MEKKIRLYLSHRIPIYLIRKQTHIQGNFSNASK